MAQVRRDWRPAFQAKGNCGCRVCGRWPAQLAHVLGRRFDRRKPGSKIRVVEADAVVPLCLSHHADYDAHRLDLWPFLTDGERGWAAGRVGDGEARRRVSGRDFADIDAGQKGFDPVGAVADGEDW